jgi:exosortase/archaeosortase family protein
MWRRAVLFSTILPIAIVANMVRILVLIFAAMIFGQNWAIGDVEKEVSAFHDSRASSSSSWRCCCCNPPPGC